MNKFILLAIVGVAIVAVGVGYRLFLIPESSRPIETGKVVRVTIIAAKNEWRFEPENIVINQGDRIIATVVNEDDYDHGIAIDAYGISQRMPAKSTITIDFVATRPGDFQYYCSVPCGEGDVDGEHRDHFDMIGTIKVHELVSGER